MRKLNTKGLSYMRGNQHCYCLLDEFQYFLQDLYFIRYDMVNLELSPQQKWQPFGSGALVTRFRCTVQIWFLLPQIFTLYVDLKHGFDMICINIHIAQLLR